MTADDARLARDVRRRFQRPGPRQGRSRPPLIGSLASGATRFAAGTRRPLPIRRALTAAAPVAARQVETQVRPPRWWRPQEGSEPAAPLDDLAPRGLPRIVTAVPDETSWRPGTISARVAPRTVPMRTPAEVKAAGPMLTSQDTRRRSSPGRPPGKPAGAGRQPPAPGAAVAPPDVAARDDGGTATRARPGTPGASNPAMPGGHSQLPDPPGPHPPVSGPARLAGPVTPPRVSQLLRRRALVTASLARPTPQTTRPRVPAWRRTRSTTLAPVAAAAPATRRPTGGTAQADRAPGPASRPGQRAGSSRGRAGTAGATDALAAPGGPERSAAVPRLRRALRPPVPVSANGARTAAVRGATGVVRPAAGPGDAATAPGTRSGTTGDAARTQGILGAAGDTRKDTPGAPPATGRSSTGNIPPRPPGSGSSPPRSWVVGSSSVPPSVTGSSAAPARAAGSGVAVPPGTVSRTAPGASPAPGGHSSSGAPGGAGSAPQPAAPAGRRAAENTHPGASESLAPVPAAGSFPIAAAPLAGRRALGADAARVGVGRQAPGLGSADAGRSAAPDQPVNGALTGAGPVRLRRLLPARNRSGASGYLGGGTPLGIIGALRSSAAGPGEPVGAAVAGRGPVRPLGYRSPAPATPAQGDQPDTVARPAQAPTQGEQSRPAEHPARQTGPDAGTTSARRPAGPMSTPTDRPGAAAVHGSAPTAVAAVASGTAPFGSVAPRSATTGLGRRSTPVAGLGGAAKAAMALTPLPVRGGLLRRSHRVTPTRDTRDTTVPPAPAGGLGIAPTALTGAGHTAGVPGRPGGAHTTAVLGPSPRIISPPAPIHSGTAAIGSPPAGISQAPLRRAARDSARLSTPPTSTATAALAEHSATPSDRPAASASRRTPTGGAFPSPGRPAPANRPPTAAGRTGRAPAGSRARPSPAGPWPMSGRPVATPPAAGLAVLPPATAAPRLVRRLLAGTPPARPTPPPPGPTAPDQRRPRTLAALLAAETSCRIPTGPTTPGQEGEALTVFPAQPGPPAPTGAPPVPASALAFRREDADSARQLEELVDLVADRVEDRMRTRLERRGHRTIPGIF